MTGIAALFLLLFGIRLLHLTADPPVDLDWSGGIFFDEGMLVHGARNKILFGRWDLDEWNDFYLSPLLTYIKWAVLSVTGVGIAQERLVPLAFSFLTLIVFYLAVRERAGRPTAVLALFLLGVNFIFGMFNRLGLTETPLVFFMVLTAYLWQKGFAPAPAGKAPAAGDGRPPGGGARSDVFFLLAGASAFLAYVFKNFPYFLPIPVVALLLARPWRRPAAPAVARAVALILLGMAVPFLAWYALFYRRYAGAIDQAMGYFQYQSVPAHLQQLWINLAAPPFFHYFEKTPVALLFACVGVGYVLYLRVHRPDRLTPLDLFMLCWFLAHFAIYLVLNYRPVRYYVPVLPPMCALAARVMIAGAAARSLALPSRLAAGAVVLLAGWLALVLGYGLLPLALRVARLAPPWPWDRQLLGAAAVALGLVGGLAVAGRIAGGRRWPVPRPVALAAFLVLPVAAALGVNGYHYARWALQPHHVIRDLSRELGVTLDHAYIAGLGAPMLVLENRHRALHVYENFFNYRNTFERYPLTHLFMGAANQEVEFYYRAYPEPMRRATLLDVHPIKESHFYLYSLVEPTIEQVRVARETYPAGEAVRVALTVRNNDGGAEREARVGVLLQPLAAGAAADLIAAAPVHLRPGETREVTVATDAAPGTYRVLGVTLPGRRHVFEAEYLAHRIGDKRDDPAATNGVAWRLQAGDPQRGQAVFGPYLRYPPGYLRATFRLKTGDNRTELPVAQIDVTADGGRTILARRDLRGVDFAAPRAYQEFALTASLEDVHSLEFRVGTYKRADLWVDRIAVEFTRGEWYPRPLTVAPRR
ncbi:MAG TPA: glycosyltransferase family 39 protein [Methylomirabilota bacterium]|jgi:4-amino-4-deoxy-L-arabinose transferase-like glycosyltransferase|nr:glycosyltransferase family 39 protein [Methylomirabilota bacterium]